MQQSNTEIRTKKERNINQDLIRVLSMLCVIAVHTYPKPLASNVIFTTIFMNLLFTCNGNFYMLSGHLNLRGRFETKRDYQNYYAKKFISIIIPFFLISCAMAVYELLTKGAEEITLLVLVKKIYVMFMSENIKIHLWFIYPLLGMLLAAPFLAKLFQAMSDWELKLLLWLALLWNTVSIYLTADWGIGFSGCSWILVDWMLAFFAGYYSERVIGADNKRKWYVLGAVCFIINIVGMVLLQEKYMHGNDLAPLYVIFNIAFYSFLKNEIKINSGKVRSVIQFVARHSFTVYLIHWIVKLQITPMIVTAERATICFCESVIVTSVISLLLAFVIDTALLFPLQKALRRKMVK